MTELLGNLYYLSVLASLTLRLRLKTYSSRSFLCFPKFHISGILRFGMVLNGKAELVEKDFGATKIHDKVELYAIFMTLAASTVITFRLYYCMENDEWQTNKKLRWQVFSLSIALLFLSVTACLYLCRRHGPTLYMSSTREISVDRENSQVSLLVCCEQPPNYNACVKPKPSMLTQPDHLLSPPLLCSAVINV